MMSFGSVLSDRLGANSSANALPVEVISRIADFLPAQPSALPLQRAGEHEHPLDQVPSPGKTDIIPILQCTAV